MGPSGHFWVWVSGAHIPAGSMRHLPNFAACDVVIWTAYQEASGDFSALALGLLWESFL